MIFLEIFPLFPQKSLLLSILSIDFSNLVTLGGASGDLR